jgi:transposase InsO family protein
MLARAAASAGNSSTAASTAPRASPSKVLPDEHKERAVAFLLAALTYYASRGVTVARVMTDNGPCYRSKTFAKTFAKTCRRLDLKHLRTWPYTPRTNGTLRPIRPSAQRTAALPASPHRYNWHRPHGGIKSQTPITASGYPGTTC